MDSTHLLACPSTMSYADIVKRGHLSHTEILKSSHLERSKATQTDRRASCIESMANFTPVRVDLEDGWTDVSSVTSCEWPSVLSSEEGGSSHGDETEGAMETLEHEGYDIFGERWCDGVPDTRAEAALASRINKNIRTYRLRFALETGFFRGFYLESLCDARAQRRPYEKWPKRNHGWGKREFSRQDGEKKRMMRGDLNEELNCALAPQKDSETRYSICDAL